MEGSSVFPAIYFDAIVRRALNDERLLFSTCLLQAWREALSEAPGGTGLEILVPLRITVEAAPTPERPGEKELLELDFVNGFQRMVCGPLKFHAKYYVYGHFFLLREVCLAVNSLSKVLWSGQGKPWHLDVWLSNCLTFQCLSV